MKNNNEISDDFLKAAMLLRLIRNDGMGHPGLLKAEKILTCIKSAQPVSEKALADQCGISSLRLKKGLKVLELDGLVVRTGKEQDAVEVNLTEKGMKAAEKIEKRAAKAGSMFDGLSEDDRGKLAEILDRLMPVLMENAECEADELEALYECQGFHGPVFDRYHPRPFSMGFMGNFDRFNGCGLFD